MYWDSGKGSKEKGGKGGSRVVENATWHEGAGSYHVKDCNN